MSQVVYSEKRESTLEHLPNRHFSVKEFHRMGEIGILSEDERVELIDGRILKMSPIGSLHAAYVSLLNRKLRSVEDNAFVRIRAPIILDDETEPQPDIAVVKFKANAYSKSHPNPEDVFLIIEVAESSLQEDREIKLPRYANSRIPEVWIVNLVENTVEVYREPLTFANGISGYRKRVDFGFGESISSKVFPNLEIDISILD